MMTELIQKVSNVNLDTVKVSNFRQDPTLTVIATKNETIFLNIAYFCAGIAKHIVYFILRFNLRLS